MKTIIACIFGLTLTANIALATTPNRVVENCWTDCSGNPANSASYSVYVNTDLLSKPELLQLFQTIGVVQNLDWRYPMLAGQYGSDDPNSLIIIQGSLNKYTEADINNGNSSRDFFKTQVETQLNELLHNDAISITCLEGCWVTPPMPYHLQGSN